MRRAVVRLAAFQLKKEMGLQRPVSSLRACLRKPSNTASARSAGKSRRYRRYRFLQREPRIAVLLDAVAAGGLSAATPATSWDQYEGSPLYGFGSFSEVT